MSASSQTPTSAGHHGPPGAATEAPACAHTQPSTLYTMGYSAGGWGVRGARSDFSRCFPNFHYSATTFPT